MNWEPVALCVGGFCLGSIPVGYLVAKARGIDIQSQGSGNIGATNVMRVLGKGPGIAVFVVDVLKGFLPSLASNLLFHDRALALGAGMCAVLGHSFSPFLKFKGGKGIATGLGMLLGGAPVVGLAAFGVFFLTMAATFMVSISSILAGISLPIFGLTLHEQPAAFFFYGLMALLVVVRHVPNIKRLLAKTEPVFGQMAGDPRPSTATKQAISGAIGVALIMAAYALWKQTGG